MDYFKTKKIPQLSYDEVIKSLSPDHQHHLELKDAKLGYQPLNTMIFGLIKKDARVQKMVNFKGSQRKRFYLNEITADKKEGEKFQILLIGNYAVKLETAMDNINCDVWLIITNSEICNYIGCERDVAKFSLRVEESFINKQPELIMIYESPSQSRKIGDKYMEYVPLNDIIQNKKYNVFVLVEEVIKQTTIIGNGNKHTMLALVDLSCMKPDAVRKDLPTNIFFNNPNENFKEDIMEGDILRIRDMLVENYAKENKIYGKIYSSNSITHFRKSEPNNVVTPITTYPNYVLSDQDRNKVIELREWWKSLSIGQQGKNVSNVDEKDEKNCKDSFLDERTISDVTEPSKFILFCQVTEIRPISNYDKLTILRVTDGTTSKVAVNRVSLHEATQDLLSPNNRAIRNVKEIDVAVFDHVDMSASIKVGDFLKLENVTAVDLNDHQDGNDIREPILDFYIEKGNGKVTILPNTHKRVRQIKSRLKCQTEPEELNSEEDSVIQIARNLQNLDANLDLKRKNNFSSKDCTLPSPLKKKSCQVDLSHTQISATDNLHSENVNLPSLRSNKDDTSASLSSINDINKLQSVKNCLASNSIQCISTESFSTAAKMNSVNNEGINGLEKAEELNDSQSELHLEGGTRSNSRNTSNDSTLSDDLQVTFFPKRIENPQLTKIDSLLGKNDIGENFIITNHATDRSIIVSNPTSNKTIASSDIFDVTSTPIRNPLNITPPYDGINMELTMIDRSSPQSSVNDIHLQKTAKTFHFKSTRKDIFKRSVYRFGHLNSLDQIIELTDYTPNLKSLSQMIQSCKMGDTWQSYIILKEILTEAEEACSECNENDDDVLCYHDIIWGVCTKGVHRIQPSELRKMYSKEELRNSEVLYCKDCPLSNDYQGNNLEFPIEPIIKLVLKVQDLSNEEIVSVYLDGDHAETFFGMKPSFRWSVAQCDIKLIYKFFTLEQKRNTPLKFGFCCYENNDKKSVQVFGTKIMGHLS